MPQPAEPAPKPKEDRLPRSERNRRRRANLQWQHALDRLRERHNPAACLKDVTSLACTATTVYMSWQRKLKTASGAVLCYEGADSVIIRVQYQGKWIKVVYCPLRQILRTVLP